MAVAAAIKGNAVQVPTVATVCGKGAWLPMWSHSTLHLDLHSQAIAQ